MRTNAFQIIIAAAGGNYPVDTANPTETVYVTTTSGGAVTLGASANITAFGTPAAGTLFRFIFGGQVTADTAGGAPFTIFGVTVPDAVALYEAEIIAFYTGSAWQISIFSVSEGVKNIDGSQLVNGSIPTAALANDAITNDKLAGITRGFIKVGDASGDPSDLDMTTSGAVPMGDGTDVNAIVLGSSGPVTFDPATGASAIGNGTITDDMLDTTPAAITSTTLEISSAQLLDLYVGGGAGTAIEVIPAPGANKLIQIIAVTSFLNYNSATYAGGGALNLNYDGTTGTVLATTPVTAVTGAVDTVGIWEINAGVDTTGVNAPVYIENLTAVFTTGDSPLKLSITYKIIDLS